MTARYVIHIGLHKTGTTYLQHAFSRLHAQLAARGICYPGWGGVHGHYLLTEVLARVGAAMQPAFDKRQLRF
jgi:hypothetical protein